MAEFRYSIFCDDIRHESGKKVSLMGIYTSAIVSKKLPSNKPSLFLFQRWDLDEKGVFNVIAKFPKKNLKRENILSMK